MLNDEQRREAVLIASVGCDRETIAKYAGCGLEELNRALLVDRAFGRELRRAEASCELAHMRNLQQAGRDVRQWRASVWWLERRAPERYAKRDAGSVGRRDLIAFLKEVSVSLAAAVRHEDDRERVIAELKTFSEAAADPLRLTDRRSPTDDDAPSEPEDA